MKAKWQPANPNSTPSESTADDMVMLNDSFGEDERMYRPSQTICSLLSLITLLPGWFIVETKRNADMTLLRLCTHSIVPSVHFRYLLKPQLNE